MKCSDVSKNPLDLAVLPLTTHMLSFFKTPPPHSDLAAAVLDSQKAFTVSYREGEDVDLSYHYDNAEVTLNVCLGKDFSGGELYFGDVKKWDRPETDMNQV